jgi:glycosyltransferase involved in cell wall biosynthesis
MNIIITSPSINPNDNVGGISNMTSLLINKNKTVNYQLFILGKKDRENRNLLWMFKQILIPIRFTLLLIRCDAHILHLNSPLVPLALIRDYVILLIALFLRYPTIIHLHGGRYMNELPTNRFVIKYIQHLLNIPDRIIVLSQIEKERLCKFYPDIKKQKIIVLPNAVEVPSNILKKEYNDSIKILFIGRIVKNKGFPEIEKALGDLLREKIDFEFILCGNGPYVEELLRSLSLIIKEKVVFKGVVRDVEKDEILRESHIFILPSYFEGLPIALLEAMGAGVIPICTPVGSIPSVIKNNENGFIIPLYDEESIVKIIMQLNKDRELMMEIGKNAHDHIKDNYSIDRYIYRLNKIYDEVVN